MSSAVRSATRVLFVTGALALVFPLFGAKGGCRCKPPADTDTGEQDPDWQKIKLERTLQISRVVPDVIEPNTGLNLDILGAGFKGRPSVTFGSYTATNVTVHTEARISADVPPMPLGTYDLVVSTPEGESVTLARALTVRAAAPSVNTVGCSKVTVYFAFDQDTLDTRARSDLDPSVPCFTQARARIRVEGHADERGTTDYNLALGQRRADAVYRYLVTVGVPVGRLRTVSYGEERPETPGRDEASWARNRRVVLVLEE
jgi:peptidoglycan-associated lipoprotein